jgi:hypothetical protein
MSVNYTAYIFIGAEVPDDHFYEEGADAFTCRNHGVQTKKFCGDCGREGQRTFEYEWSPEMQRAATASNTTPELLWERIAPDGGMYIGDEKGKFGRWAFGYENDHIIFGTALASVGDDDRPGNDKAVLTPEQVQAAIAAVRKEFKRYGIETPVKVHCIMDCG